MTLRQFFILFSQYIYCSPLLFLYLVLHILKFELFEVKKNSRESLPMPELGLAQVSYFYLSKSIIIHYNYNNKNNMLESSSSSYKRTDAEFFYRVPKH